MSRSALRLGLTFALLLDVALAQMHLITGAPEQEFPMTLVQVTGDGSVKSVAVLVPKWFLPGATKWPAPTVQWFGISYDSKKAVILPADDTKPIMVLDLDRAEVVKRCAKPQIENYGLFAQWLADVPGRGFSFECQMLSDDITRSFVQSMNPDPSVPCEESFVTVSLDDVRYVVAHGNPGVADINAQEGVAIRIDKDGNIEKAMSGTSVVGFGYQIPAELRIGLIDPGGWVIVNNSRILVVNLGPDGTGNTRYFAFRKQDKTWHLIPVRSDWYGRLRGFDNFVAVVEGRIKKTMEAQRGKSAIYRGLKDEPGDESAGRKEWRKAPSETGPDMEIEFMNAASVYPGRLHLFDVDTERLFTITTNQADSEILLVENNTVYYRVSDRLYAAPITSKGIGTARLMASADLIRDAHWAFIKH